MRDIGLATVTATPRPNLDLTTTFRTQRHVGELPWGASFGFGNDVEVPGLYNSRANDLTVGAEWTNQTSMLWVAYDGSWFQNHDETLEWDSPLRLDDSTSAPGRGRMALGRPIRADTELRWLQEVRAHTSSPASCPSARGATTSRCFPSRSTLRCRNCLSLARTTQADAQVFSMNLNVVSRPVTDWRLSARFRQ